MKKTFSMVRYLGQQEAINIDLELFNEYKFSVDQLMELAGLSVATAVKKTYQNAKTVLVCCGPGNNGGDGLVAARHLSLFGLVPTVFYPKQPANTLYKNLKHQCMTMKIPILQQTPSQSDVNSYDVILDALFGFSFKPPVRAEFQAIIECLENTSKPICSVDIPSGWDVETGASNASGIRPDTLVSLTAPKKCAELFCGQFHYIGGRFVPPSLAEKYNLQLPEYPGTDCVVKVENK